VFVAEVSLFLLQAEKKNADVKNKIKDLFIFKY
jgi:hypothetical protein